MKFLKWSFILWFACAAIFHLVLAFVPKDANVAAGQVHLLFVLIYLVATCLVAIDRPKVLFALAPLILQQVYDHGRILWREWDTYQQVDYLSVAVLIAMPTLTFYIYRRYSSKIISI